MTNPRLPRVTYEVTWTFRENPDVTPYTETLLASSATRAISQAARDILNTWGSPKREVLFLEVRML